MINNNIVCLFAHLSNIFRELSTMTLRSLVWLEIANREPIIAESITESLYID